jgi:SAM-dependent methyltransferase
MWFRASNLLKRLDSRCRALLEIGCGDGTFLDVLNDKLSSDCTLTGIDLMSQPKRHARLNIIRGEFEKTNFGTTFDAVVMYGALEHLADPLHSLRRISELLTPDGLLIGDVPNWDSCWRKIFPRHWSGLQIPRHQTMFSPLSLKRMLNVAGYDLVGLRYIYDPGDLSVSICNWVSERLRLQTRPRQAWFFFPAAILCAPLVALVNTLTRDSGNMEFTARKL